MIIPIPVIWVIVLVFPNDETLTRLLLEKLAIHSLSDITKISLIIIKIVITNNIIDALWYMREISTKKTRNLSAIGSRNSPNLDSSDFLLAKKPSIASLKEPSIKRITAAITEKVESKNNNVDTIIAKKNLDKVIIVGKYVINFLFSVFKYKPILIIWVWIS